MAHALTQQSSKNVQSESHMQLPPLPPHSLASHEFGPGGGGHTPHTEQAFEQQSLKVMQLESQ